MHVEKSQLVLCPGCSIVQLCQKVHLAEHLKVRRHTLTQISLLKKTEKPRARRGLMPYPKTGLQAYAPHLLQCRTFLGITVQLSKAMRSSNLLTRSQETASTNCPRVAEGLGSG